MPAWSGPAAVVFRARHLFVLVALLGASPALANAEAVATASQATARVISLQQVDDGFNYSTGSGVVVAPNRLVTNYHVVRNELDSGIVIVVPSTGDHYLRARVLYYDALQDLALIEFAGDLPVAPIAKDGARVQMPVVALGYPGNLDRAFAPGLGELIAPSSPTSPPGAIISLRTQMLYGRTMPSIIHNAQIGPGFSGGPLLDSCGRVIGINRAVPRNEAGDAQYGITIPADILLDFLTRAGVKAAPAEDVCVTEEERLAEQNKALVDEAEKKRLADYARERDRLEQERANETYATCREDGNEARLRLVLALAMLLLAGGGLTAWAAHKGRRKLMFAGIALTIAAGGYGAYVLIQPLACERPHPGS
jgi:hypothetical protein